jgi:chaperone BCS1
MHTVILKEGLVQKLTDDISSFVDRQGWYKEMNIPWRRGYLLQGPPGNGKSSLVTAMASEFGFDVRVVNLSNIGEDDLLSLMADVPAKSILLFEDIDCAFIERENQKPISMSTMLNVLDGVQATEGRIVVMTTNHPERLDPALIRAGRIDLTLTLDNPDEEQVIELADRFYGSAENFTQAARKVASAGYSMADLQGIFLQFADDADAARSRLKRIK